MSDLVQVARAGRVAVLTLAGPPVNALGAALRQALDTAVTQASADPAVAAIVLTGARRGFSAGADIREFGGPPASPDLGTLCNRIEACPKPVVAAIHGMALGGGLELALAAHYRLADAGAQLGLPEVTLGILPGAGGTQRTPRLTGAEAALRLMLTGAPIGAAEALALRLLDRVVPGDLLAAAVAFAATGPAPRPTLARREGFSDPLGYQAAVRAARARLADGPIRGPALAPRRIVDCVEAAQLLPPPAGLDYERAAFADCAASDAAAGLQHLFLAERRAVPRPRAAAPPVDLVGVIGAGRSGGGIVAACLAAGLRCVLIERDRPALVAALERLAAAQERAVAAGRLTAAARDAEWARLGGSTDLAALAQADLVITALPSDLAATTGVLGRLHEVLAPGAVIGIAGADLPLAPLAAATDRPEAVLGLNFFLPVRAMAAVELARLPDTDPAALARVAAFASTLGKVAVPVAGQPGRVGGRLSAALGAAAERAVLAGASPEAVDTALAGFGMATGPFRATDLAGLDRVWPARLAEAGGDAAHPGVALLARLIGEGRQGRQAGAGWYRWTEAGPQPDPAVAALIAAEQAQRGILPVSPPPEEIVRRCLAAMVRTACGLLAGGVAVRPSDIDVLAVLGLGLPRWRGGPLHWADRQGLLSVQLAMADDDPSAPPPPLLADLIKNGRRFASLNG